MCLTIDNNSRNEAASLIKSIRKSGKPLTAYKVLLYNNIFNQIFAPYKNVPLSLGENISNRNSFNLMTGIKLKNPSSMSPQEKKEGRVYYGFHLFLNLEDAKKFETGLQKSINRDLNDRIKLIHDHDCAITVSCSIKPNDIVVTGDWSYYNPCSDRLYVKRCKSVVCNKLTIDPLLQGNEQLNSLALSNTNNICSIFESFN